MTHPCIELLLQRHSTPAKMLAEPAPHGEARELILRAALSAPDHAALRPWRFLLVEHEGLQRLAEVFAESLLRRQPHATAEQVARERDKATRSPLLLMLIFSRKDNAKVPEWEQMMSLGAAASHMQLMANALGFGSIWLSGERCMDPWLMQQLGLAAHERLMGYLALGTPSAPSPSRERGDPWQVTQCWPD